MRIEIWADVICPWCYIGARHLELALEQFERTADVVFRSFLIDGGSPPGKGVPIEDAFRARGIDPAAVTAGVERAAARVGIALHLAGTRLGNTFDVHQVLQLALAEEKQGAVLARLQRGYFTEGRNLFDAETLLALAVEGGLSRARVAAALDAQEFAAAVTADVNRAKTLGITGAPYFLFEGGAVIRGAQPVETILTTLHAVWR